MAVETVGKEVFIVHGRNDDLKTEVSIFLTNFRLHPIILNEQANEGMTVIEKFERHANAGYAIVLMTDDDLGKEKSEINLRARARQNVILELGYFMAKRRSRVCILYSKGVELPTDLGGIVYIEIDAIGEWKKALEKELRKAGYDNIFTTLSIANETLRLNKELKPYNNCRISTLGIGTQEQSVSIEGNFADDYVDIFFDSHGQKIVEVEYIFVDFKDFLFYVHISCFDKNTNTNVWRWMSLKNQLFVISTIPGELETAFPVTSISLSRDWKQISLNIAKAFEQRFNSDNLQFSNLERMRIRGSGKLLSITLR